MQAIQMKGLVKRYKDLTAVNKLDLDIRQGELFSLLGVNGAGKTTAIKMLSCLTEPTEGDAMVGGYSVREEADRVRRQFCERIASLFLGHPPEKEGKQS